MNLKVFSSLPSAPSFPGSNEIITNCWPLPWSPEEIHPQGIPIPFEEKEIGQIPVEPIAWPCDEATSRWISEDVDEAVAITPEEP